METIEFSAKDQRIKRISGLFEYASDTVDYIKAKFDVDWDVDDIRAIWSNGVDIATEIVNGECIIPPEVLTQTGKVSVNLVGSNFEDGELSERITTYSITALLVIKTKIDGENSEITPTEFEQFVAQVHEDAGTAQESATQAVKAAEEAVEAASTASKVENLTVASETLPPGSEATVTKTEEGKSFNLTFGIPRGQDGVDGATFTPSVSNAGVLSWTNDQGKQNPQSVDIVAAVLAALPVWQGGAY